MAAMTEEQQTQHFKMLFAAEFAKRDCDLSSALQILNKLMVGFSPKMEWLQLTSKQWAVDDAVLAEVARIKAYIPTPDEVKAKVWFDYSNASEEGKAKMQRNVLEAYGVIKKNADDDGPKGIDKLQEMIDASEKQ